MSKATKKTEPKDVEPDDKTILDSWQPHIKSTMKKLHDKFKGDGSKYILTESDLKCWLFYYLQQEKPYLPFAVHTEVTHYHIKKHKNEEEKDLYSFRDLSLLCPWKLKANVELMKKLKNEGGVRKKGFSHKAPAIHFELKFIRDGGNMNTINYDLKKLNSYHPDNNSSPRRLVIIWGSRSDKSVFDLENKLKKELEPLKNQKLNNILEFFLFDKISIKFAKWEGESGSLTFNADF